MMKFNSINCIEKNCFSHSILCIKFAVGNKVKNILKSEKLTAVDSEINIQLVNAKYFFRMIQKKTQEISIDFTYQQKQLQVLQN